MVALIPQTAGIRRDFIGEQQRAVGGAAHLDLEIDQLDVDLGEDLDQGLVSDDHFQHPSLKGVGDIALDLGVQEAEQPSQLLSQPAHRPGRISVARLILVPPDILIELFIELLKLLSGPGTKGSFLHCLHDSAAEPDKPGHGRKEIPVRLRYCLLLLKFKDPRHGKLIPLSDQLLFHFSLHFPPCPAPGRTGFPFFYGTAAVKTYP